MWIVVMFVSIYVDLKNGSRSCQRNSFLDAIPSAPGFSVAASRVRFRMGFPTSSAGAVFAVRVTSAAAFVLSSSSIATFFVGISIQQPTKHASHDLLPYIAAILRHLKHTFFKLSVKSVQSIGIHTNSWNFPLRRIRPITGKR